MRTLRLPLGIGVASLQALSIAFLTIPLGLAIVGAVVAFVIWASDGGDALGYILAAGLGVLGYGYMKLRRAWKYRPSDLVFEEKHLRVEGGSSANAQFPWDDLDPKKCVVREVIDKDKNGKETGKRWILEIHKREIAEADDELEAESFREITHAIEARVSGPIGDQSVEKPAELLSCPTCGAPIAPTGDDRTKCPHCDGSVVVPTELRDRVRATTTLTKANKRIEKLARKLLDQPGARSTTIFLWISFALIGSAWPVTAWMYTHLYFAHELTVARGFALATLPFLLIADGFFLSRLRLVDRRALGTLTTQFGANPPLKKGDPLRCRSCSGPLPAAQAVVVTCVFCNASNITGIDLRANAHRAGASARSLEDAFAHRVRERRKWQLRTLASVPLFVIAPLVIRDTLKVKADTPVTTSARP